MKVREVMTSPVISIGADESVDVAARTLTHYNIGALPVRGKDEKLCGVVTDRDIVTRCLAGGRLPENTRVRDIMSSRVMVVTPEDPAAEAAAMMCTQQVRRLPVVDRGVLCGMISLGDLANHAETAEAAAGALTGITDHISYR